MILIVGLGNPGPQYQKTRHNAGYMVLDELAAELKILQFKPESKFKAEIASADIHGGKILLAKPITFMNLSGQAVQSLMQFYKIDPENLWVIYDDLDLPLGQIRIRREGSPGTHNGMKSVVQYIGKDFPRFRVGIESRGASAPHRQDTSSFVLSAFGKEEGKEAEKAIKKAAEAIMTALKEGLTEAMNQYNAP